MTSNEAGASLIEVLVALLIGATVVAGGVLLAFGGEQLFRSNQGRTEVNQSLRAGMNLLGGEIREAGRLLPADFVAFELVNGPFSTPDELVVRKNLQSVVMPFCADVASSSSRTQVIVADTGGTPPPGCAPVPDSDADGWPDNLGVWRAERLAAGGTLVAYAYNPVTRLGEFFDITGEDSANYRLDTASGTWTNAYTIASGSRVYVLEERRFRLTGDLLETVVNEDTGNALGIVDRVDDLQFRIVLEDSSTLTSFGSADEWSQVETVEVTLVGSSNLRGQSTQRRLVGRFNPRNTMAL